MRPVQFRFLKKFRLLFNLPNIPNPLVFANPLKAVFPIVPLIIFGAILE